MKGGLRAAVACLVLVLSGFLASDSGPALAEESGAGGVPADGHAALVGAVEGYVAMMFSDGNTGGVVDRDGKIHKWRLPIKVHVSWPKCEAVIGTRIEEFNAKTGLNVEYERGDAWDGTMSILIIQVADANSIRSSRTFYDWLVRDIYFRQSELDEALDVLDAREAILMRLLVDREGSHRPRFMVNIISDKWPATTDCNNAYGLIHAEIINASIREGEADLTDLDYLYVSALYDPSVLVDEDESSAKIKIRDVMIRTLERTK